MTKIAIFQMTSGIDPKVNAKALEAAIREAAQKGAAMLFTPEMSGLLDSNRDRARRHMVPEENNPVLRLVQETAASAGIWVHLGSLALAGSGKSLNRGFLIDDQGAIRARYDKLHLFDVDLPTGESWRESNAYSAGAGAVVASCPLGALGLSICYDVRFPALYQGLSSSGATVLSIPAAFTVPTGEAHWHVLLRARAIENACWVIATAQSGVHEDGRKTYGHSLVIDPWGQIVLDMGEGTGIGYADIDADTVSAVRARIPVIAHRRAIPAVEVRP